MAAFIAVFSSSIAAWCAIDSHSLSLRTLFFTSCAANHWFHVAECFTGLRAGLEAAGTIKGGNDTVYLQVRSLLLWCMWVPLSKHMTSS